MTGKAAVKVSTEKIKQCLISECGELNSVSQDFCPSPGNLKCDLFGNRVFADVIKSICVCVCICTYIYTDIHKHLPWTTTRLQKRNFAICSKMYEPGDYHTKWDKSDGERQISYAVTSRWNLKKKCHRWTFLENRNRLTDIINKFVVTKGERGAAAN